MTGGVGSLGSRSSSTLLSLAFVLAGAIALWLSFGFLRAPYVANDGYQYLDAVSNIAAGRCVCINLAHFDEQVATGRFPIPFTHFPPGYPLLTAVIARTGVPADTAGYIISAAGFLVTIWLIWDIGLQLGAHPFLIAVFSLLWIGNEAALLYAAAVGTEGAFTAALMAVAALMVRDLHAEGGRPHLLLAIGVMAGVSYWLRYAGLFLLPVAGLYILWRCWQSRRDRRILAWGTAGLATAGILTFSIQIRNIAYTGSWRGGFIGGAGHSLRQIAAPLVKALYHLVFGDRVITRPDIWTAVFLASALAACFFSIQGLRRREGSAQRKFLGLALTWIGILAASYTAGLILTALTSIAADFSRYFVPLYPLVLASVAALASLAPLPRQFLAVSGMAIVVLALQSRSLLIRPAPADHVLARETLQQEVQPGVSGLEWLRDRVPASGVLFAVDGQAVHYILDRPVVSVIEPGSSSRPTGETAFHSLMQQFGAKYLLVFPDSSSPYLDSQNENPLMRNIAAGNLPEWLTLAARAPNIAIYECASCAR